MPQTKSENNERPEDTAIFIVDKDETFPTQREPKIHMKRLNAVFHKCVRDVNKQFLGRQLAQGCLSVDRVGPSPDLLTWVCKRGEWNVILIIQKFLGMSLPL